MKARSSSWGNCLLALGVMLATLRGHADALSTAFTYQGQLQQSGLSANGTCDFQFRLFDALSGGSQVNCSGGIQVTGCTCTGNPGDPAISCSAMMVTNGLFTVSLDFGTAAFTGNDRYLQSSVRCPAGSGSYTTFPHQQLTAEPNALYATTAGSANGLTCSGCVTTATLAPGAVTGSTIASGTIQASNLGFTPVLSVGAISPLASSGGQNPSISLSGTVTIANGGTNSSTAPGARTSLGAAASGANADITSLSGITGNITLPTSANSNVGNIVKGGARFMHDFGTRDTFLGASAGNFTLTGTDNTAMGNGALAADTTGAFNTAVGSGALASATTAISNTAVGNVALQNNINGSGNTAVGEQALQHATTGGNNTAVGIYAMINNTTGSNNVAVGESALGNYTGSEDTAVGYFALSNTNGGLGVNTAVGAHALENDTTGDQSVALGHSALFSNTGGTINVAVGYQALYSNTNAYGGTAVGKGALSSNTTANNNTAVGAFALGANTIGGPNTAVGAGALAANTTGGPNTAVGASALGANVDGVQNVAVGESALGSSQHASANVAVGSAALSQVNANAGLNTAVGAYALQFDVAGDSNTAVGYSALIGATGSSNTALGRDALRNSTGGGNIGVGRSAGVNLTTGNNNIDVGNVGGTGESNTIRIGDVSTQTQTFIAGISNNNGACASGTPVYVGSSGQLSACNAAGFTLPFSGTVSASVPAFSATNSGNDTGVAGTSTNGTGVAGTSTNGADGVLGISTGVNGNGVVGIASNGSAAYGVWGQSTTGYAGYFSGKVQANGDVGVSGRVTIQSFATSGGTSYVCADASGTLGLCSLIGAPAPRSASSAPVPVEEQLQELKRENASLRADLRGIERQLRELVHTRSRMQ